jgi:hypothetical protein
MGRVPPRAPCRRLSGLMALGLGHCGRRDLTVVVQMPSTQATAYGGTRSLSSCIPNRYLYGSLSSEWKQISVPFSSLKGGTVTPLNPATIATIQFEYSSDTSAPAKNSEIWVDDLSFY